MAQVGRVPALQAQGPTFKPQKERKKRTWTIKFEYYESSMGSHNRETM